MSTILTDRLLSDDYLLDLEEYGVDLVARIDHICRSADDSLMDYQRKSALFARNTYEDLCTILDPFLKKCKRRGDLMRRHDVDSDTSGPQISASMMEQINGILSQLNDKKPTTQPILPETEKLINLILLLSSVAILVSLGSFLFNSTLAVSDDITYYDSVIHSGLYTVIYTIQSFPLTLAHLGQGLYSHMMSRQSLGTTVTGNANVGIKGLWINWIKPIPMVVGENFTEFMHSPSAYLVKRQKQSHSVARMFFASTLGLPFFYAESQLNDHRKSLQALNASNVSRLGFLIDEVIPLVKGGKADDALDYTICSKLGVVCAKKFDPATIKSREDSIYETASRLYTISTHYIPNFEDRVSEISRKHKQPSLLTKIWPFALLAYRYIPGIVSNIVDNQDEIYTWWKENVYETAVSFWKNWVVKPVMNIWKTIRHDDESKIAVMSKQSLNSDLDSLERMVVDYCVDNYSEMYGGQLDSASKSQLVQQIQDEVKNGNMEMVMKMHEKNLKTPFKSIASGNMVRNLLIQIQKTKVDGDVALSGIDKILQSQELVFGLLAASPACLAVWYSIQTLRTYLSSGGFILSGKTHKRRAYKSIIVLRRFADLQQNDGDEAYYNSGLMYLELVTLRKEGVLVLPPFLRGDWIRDLNDVVRSVGKSRLTTIQRIWDTYVIYLR